MNQPEFEQLFKNGGVDIVPPSPAPTPAPLAPLDLGGFLPLLVALRLPREHLTSAPTFTPKNFLEQIQFVDTGAVQTLYLYINKTWRSVVLT